VLCAMRGLLRPILVRVVIKCASVAIDAGYSPKTANPSASRMLANVNVKSEVGKAIDASYSEKRG
jgi:phage terminase small subunit